jgi:adenosylmethionine-8-amino-7-oxononanoate aminotransferase
MVFPTGTTTAAALVAMCREKGLLLRPVSEDAVGIRLPVIVTPEQVDRAFDIIEEVLARLGEKKRLGRRRLRAGGRVGRRGLGLPP